MNVMSFDSGFGFRYAGTYDRFMRKEDTAYRQMLGLIRPAVKGKIVLEIATGTGLIATNILHDAEMVEATDNSPEMIAQAKALCCSSKLHFSVQDVFSLPYADESFPIIIAANVLHMISNPKKALDEIRRVLTEDGLLIVPTFTYGDLKFAKKMKARMMHRIGFPLRQNWSSKEYLTFLTKNGWHIQKEVLINSFFPLTYVECMKESGSSSMNGEA